MIITTLLGGLGNQMFQYAIGRALSLKCKTDLFIDVSHYSDDPLRQFQLDYFPIHAKICSDEDFSRIIPYDTIINKISAHSKKLFFGKKPIILKKEISFSYDPNILRNSDNVCLLGFWQSEKYFSGINEIIRNDFRFPQTLSPKNYQYLKHINKTTSVSIHIRHGDYLTDLKTFNYHGVCSTDYYHNSMKLIEKQIEDPEYFVFSDDPEWARKNITSAKSMNYIDWNSTAPHEDLRLMASCKHHIIANSSFSWWAAWLGKNDRQIVIAPKPWFDSKKHEPKDIYAEGWICIDK